MFDISDDELRLLEEKFNDHNVKNIVVNLHYSHHFRERVKQRVINCDIDEFIKRASHAVKKDVRNSGLEKDTGIVSILVNGKRYRIVYERNGRRDFALVTVLKPHKEYNG